jgi:hypothetical protein
MSTHLSGRGGEFHSEREVWAKTLQLAHYYGWRPVTKTHNLYLSDAGRLVTAKDAANIANALEKALADIPDDSVQEEEPEVTASAYDYFSGAGKQHLRDLIAFCRAGDFTINKP